MTAIVAGTFDPFTVGHLDIVQRAAKIFGSVIVAVAVDTGKTTVAPAQTRAAYTELAVSDISGVTVEVFSGALSDYIAAKGDCVLVRGIRSAVDLDYERDHSRVYESLCGVPTVMLYASAAVEHVSSTTVRTLCELSCPLDGYVPQSIAGLVRKLYGKEAK